jgi:molybdopterin-guanine dinucleotide biosynthesis protein A
MGSDKGLLKNNSITWTEIALNKFKALKLPVILSVNHQQYSLYSKTFLNSVLIKDNATLKIGGPLKGILSVHLQQPEDDLLVTACDMPDMQTEVLEQLITASTTTEAEAFAFRSNEHTEPLTAIYMATGLKKINSLYRNEGLKRFSLHYVLEVLQTTYFPLPEQWKPYFYNFNTPQDLRGK